MAFLFNWLIKISSWLGAMLLWRPRIIYEDKKAQSRRIKGAAILVANHTTLLDFGFMMHMFPLRTLRCVVAEVLYKKNFFMTLFLRMLGTVRVERESHDFSFLGRCKEILDRGGVVEMYPESRLPRAGEERPLEFKPSVVYLALESGAPIIPCYLEGVHISKKRAGIMVGRPIYVRELYDDRLDEKENIAAITAHIREKVIELGYEFDRNKKAKD